MRQKNINNQKPLYNKYGGILMKNESIKFNLFVDLTNGVISKKEIIVKLKCSNASYYRAKNKFDIRNTKCFAHRGIGNKNAAKHVETDKEIVVEEFRKLNKKLIENEQETTLLYSTFINIFCDRPTTNQRIKKIPYKTFVKILKDGGCYSSRSTNKKQVFKKPHLENPENKKVNGEVFQIDGSFNYKFKDEESEMAFISIVDEGSNRILEVDIEKSETLKSYYLITFNAILKYGKPKKIIVDGRVTEKSDFKKILEEMGIEVEITHNPRKKNQVEKAHDSIRMHLIPLLIEKNITTIASAKEYLNECIDKVNTWLNHDSFENQKNSKDELLNSFVTFTTRTMSVDSTISLNKVRYFLVKNNKVLQLKKGIVVTIHENKLFYEVFVIYNGCRYELVEATIENEKDLEFSKYRSIRYEIGKLGYNFYFNKEYYHIISNTGLPQKFPPGTIIEIFYYNNSIEKVKTPIGILHYKAGKYTEIKVKQHFCKLRYTQSVKYNNQEYALIDQKGDRILFPKGTQVELLITDNTLISVIVEEKEYKVVNCASDPTKFPLPSSNFVANQMFGFKE